MAVCKLSHESRSRSKERHYLLLAWCFLLGASMASNLCTELGLINDLITTPDEASKGKLGIKGLLSHDSLLCLRFYLTRFMNKREKGFKSVNMEEFMKNICTTEDSKAGIAALASSAAENTGSNRQNSLSLPPALNNKIVEDVWGDIQRQSVIDLAEKQHQHQHQHQRQETLGEMTLEDFLVRTGVVREDPDAVPHTAESNNFYPRISTASVSNSFSSTMDALVSCIQPDWMNYPPHPHQHQQLLQQTEAVAATKRGFQPPSLVLPAGSSMYDGIADNAALGPDSFSHSLALSPGFSDYSMHNRKRFTSEVAVEKTMERRQKRMIKNRESAARSRARKQAYTVELEAEVTLLKEENARLKQQQVFQSRLPEAVCVQNSKTRVLRRTQSC